MSVNDILANFDFDTIVLDDNEIDQMINENKPKLTVRSTKELIKDHKNRVKEAIQQADICDTNDEKSFVCQSADLITTSKLRDLKKNSMNDLLKDIKKCMLTYAFIYGSYNGKRAWIKLNLQEDKKNLYISFRHLLAQGNHSSMMVDQYEKISTLCEKKDNTIITLLKRGGIEVANEKRKFCFSKGAYVDEAVKDVVQHDLDIIFAQMKIKTVATRDFSKLRYLNQK